MTLTQIFVSWVCSLCLWLWTAQKLRLKGTKAFWFVVIGAPPTTILLVLLVGSLVCVVSPCTPE